MSSKFQPNGNFELRKNRRQMLDFRQNFNWLLIAYMKSMQEMIFNREEKARRKQNQMIRTEEQV